MTSRRLQQVDHLAETLKDFCERRQGWLLCSFSIIYLISTALLASTKPLWNDELFTYYISRLPTLSDMWSALRTGGEQIPPFFHIITRASLRFFGVSELTIRLPEVVGFLVMSLCLYKFVTKRSSALCGCVAMLFPLVTKAYSYAYEARPYGIVLGLAGLSLVCWQSAVEGLYRKLSLFGLAVSLAAAVSCHYYAILLLVPLAIGEAARSISLRRLDLSILVASGCGILPLLVFAPLIQQARTYSATFWGKPAWGQIIDFYYQLLTPAIFPLMIVIVVAALYLVTLPERGSYERQESHFALPLHELAAILGFIMMPVVLVIVAKLFTGAVAFRYVLPTIIGFSILFAFVADRVFDGRRVIPASLVVLMCGGFLVQGAGNFQRLTDISSAQAKTYAFLQSNNERQLPIVASDPHTFMTLAHYAPPDITSRLVYLADPQASLRYLRHSTVDQGMLDLKPWFGLNIQDYASYVASQRQFLVYGPIGWLNWLVSDLTASSNRIELIGRDGDNLLFLVSIGEHADDRHAGNSAGSLCQGVMRSRLSRPAPWQESGGSHCKYWYSDFRCIEIANFRTVYM